MLALPLPLLLPVSHTAVSCDASSRELHGSVSESGEKIKSQDK